MNLFCDDACDVVIPLKSFCDDDELTLLRGDGDAILVVVLVRACARPDQVLVRALARALASVVVVVVQVEAQEALHQQLYSSMEFDIWVDQRGRCLECTMACMKPNNYSSDSTCHLVLRSISVLNSSQNHLQDSLLRGGLFPRPCTSMAADTWVGQLDRFLSRTVACSWPTIDSSGSICLLLLRSISLSNNPWTRLMGTRQVRTHSRVLSARPRPMTATQRNTKLQIEES